MKKKKCVYCNKTIKRRKCKCLKRELRLIAKEISLELKTKELGK